MTMPTYTTADIEDFERQLAELKTALLASRERIASTHRTSHSMQMAHADMLSRYDTMRQRVDYMKAVAPMINVGVTAPPPVTKQIAPVGASRPLRKLGDALPNRGEIRKTALVESCICASSHHRTCSYCGECAVMCGHRSI